MALKVQKDLYLAQFKPQLDFSRCYTQSVPKSCHSRTLRYFDSSPVLLPEPLQLPYPTLSHVENHNRHLADPPCGSQRTLSESGPVRPGLKSSEGSLHHLQGKVFRCLNMSYKSCHDLPPCLAFTPDSTTFPPSPAPKHTHTLCPSNTSDTFLPQDICISCSFSLNLFLCLAEDNLNRVPNEAENEGRYLFIYNRQNPHIKNI